MADEIIVTIDDNSSVFGEVVDYSTLFGEINTTPDAQVFVAYGTGDDVTSFDELNAAYKAKKIIMFSRGGGTAMDGGSRKMMLTYVRTSGVNAQFAFTDVSAEISADGSYNARKLHYAICRPSGWTISMMDLVQSVNGNKPGTNGNIALTIPTVPTDDITANTSARHTHSNKSVLDGITSSNVTSWNNKQDAISDIDSIRSGAAAGAAVPIDDVSANTSARHSHENKTALDVIELQQIPFVAIQGETTNAEITKAVSDNRPVFLSLVYNNISYLFTNLKIDTSKFTWTGQIDWNIFLTVELVGMPVNSWLFNTTELQTKITDLSTIRSGAAAGAKAVQPEAGKGLFSGSYSDLTNRPTDILEIPKIENGTKGGYIRYNTAPVNGIFTVTGSATRTIAYNVEGIRVIGFDGVTDDPDNKYDHTYWCVFYKGENLTDAVTDGGTFSGSDGTIDAPINKDNFIFVCASIDNLSSIPVPSDAKLFIVSLKTSDENLIKVYNKQLSYDGINGLIDAKINDLEEQSASILNLVGSIE